MTAIEPVAIPAPQALAAEEAVLGCLLLAGAHGHETAAKVAEQVREAGLEARHFYRAERNAGIFAAALTLVEAGRPCDVLGIADELRRRHELDAVGGKERLFELAALALTTANAGHYASLVVDAARRREQADAARALEAASTNGGLEAHPEVRERLAALLAVPRTPTSALEPLDLGELLAGPVPETPWRWGGWLAQGDLALVVGDSGVGKSLLTLALADAMRRGASFLGTPCRKGKVGIVDLENPLSEAHKRLRSVGVTAESHEGLVYVHAPALDLRTQAGHDGLAGLLEEHELDLLVVDSLRRAAPSLDENDSAAVSAVLSPLRALTASSGRTILLVHHARKRTAEGSSDAGQMVRGSGDLVASVDSLLFLRGKEGAAFTLEHAKSRRGVPHESILVRIEVEGDHLRLVSEGGVASADDRVEAMLARVLEALRADGGPLGRPQLALRIGVASNSGTFTRALKLGWQRELLAKDDPEKVGAPTLYALVDGVFG